MEESTDQLVTLRHFRDLPDALLAQGKIESAGIECLLADGNLVRMDWLWSNAIGGLRLQVSESDVEEARAILDEPIPESLVEDDKGEAFLQPRCPRCDSLDIGFQNLDHFWTYGLWLLTGLPIPIRKDHWRCGACGAQWVDTGE
jgi:hypothetical protein